MKVTIKLITRDKKGRQRTMAIEGKFITALNSIEDAKSLWYAEQAINANTNIRCHIELSEEQDADN